ncbi:MSC_0621 family F1-like ATPase epsilon subunit [Mycoplasma tauri]|uniref:MSC_0621 family F1-like ATPase epsilon subunit n=1 Tax=Mycoplasma tauri TaxID=547987 RepID=UPI001CBFC0A3|nr:hypothetical protein [Mycoplasma tauri]MBZ4204109.1 hypothetical protein [Mycoplasma tauri]
MSTKYFKTTISFIFDKKIMFDNSEVFVYLNDENEWVKVTNNSIFGYEIVLLKIYDHINEKEFYIFAKNSNIIAENDNIYINTTSYLDFYQISKVKKSINENIKILDKKIASLENMQKIGMDLELFLKLKKIKQEQYILRNTHKFNLKKIELDYEN